MTERLAEARKRRMGAQHHLNMCEETTPQIIEDEDDDEDEMDSTKDGNGFPC